MLLVLSLLSVKQGGTLGIPPRTALCVTRGITHKTLRIVPDTARLQYAMALVTGYSAFPSSVPSSFPDMKPGG